MNTNSKANTAGIEEWKPTKQMPPATTQPELRFRMFTAVYFGPGNVKGSRIVITDLRHNKRKILDYDDGAGRTFEQATAYLRSIGITVDALGLANADAACTILSRDIATQLH